MTDLDFCEHCGQPFEPGRGFDDVCSADCAAEASASEWACDELEGETA
jgi:hypothetical protein